MIEQQTCPHCGADGYFNVRDADWRYECHSSCNADGAEFYISEDCYQRQLAAKDAEIEKLKQAVLDEREACAKLLERTDLGGLKSDVWLQNYTATILDGYAKAIRARGEE